MSAASKAQVVHSPFDTELRVDRDRARRQLIEELGVSPDTVLVGYFGLFIARKRPLLFIDAIGRMRELAAGRPIVGVMFGAAEDPTMDERIRSRIAAAGLGDAVRLMGWRSPGVDWIAACDVLMVPAIEEPFGRTLIEAMLVRTPIVATRSGGNIEALRGGQLGMLVEPENAEALAEAALCLAGDRGSVFADRAETDARIRFGVQKHCQMVSEVYANLLTRNRRRHVD
jgi:glycosyltransferase involved in cell wall biosynthesis